MRLARRFYHLGSCLLGFCLVACTSNNPNVTDGPSGHDLLGRDLLGRDLAGQDLAGQDLAGRDLLGVDLSSPPPPDLRGGPDLSGRDLAIPPDLSQPTRPAVRCGGTLDKPTLCPAADSVCCSSDEGKSGVCVNTPNTCPTPAEIPYSCDQPADCDTGQVCCLGYSGATPTGSACTSTNQCTTKSGKLLCRVSTDCPGQQSCCPFTGLGELSYLYCTTGVCPP